MDAERSGDPVICTPEFVVEPGDEQGLRDVAASEPLDNCS